LALGCGWFLGFFFTFVVGGVLGFGSVWVGVWSSTAQKVGEQFWIFERWAQG
jgi:hypothetical protein